MSLDEAPIDCFRVRCLITGTDDEIEKQRVLYLEKYPYLCFGTRSISKTADSVIVQRFRTQKICAEACVHTPVANPLGADNEEGKDHTIFQTY
jgi:hypothetical protein